MSLDILLRKLGSISRLTENDANLIRSIPFRVVQLDKGTDLVNDGETARSCCVVLDGWMHRSKMLSEGQRQILSFHPPGDVPDLPSLHLKKVDYSLTATTEAKVGLVEHADLQATLRQSASLMEVFWRDTLIDSARFLTWMLMIGRASAEVRMAHLFCEMSARVDMHDPVEGGSFRFPITQSDLADALGMSTVHANRTLQDLRGAGLLSFEGGVATILDWKRLSTLGDFDAAYLHLDEA